MVRHHAGHAVPRLGPELVHLVGADDDGLRMARQHMFFSDAKARRDLGYASRPYREGIVDAISWFREAGYLR